MCLITVSAREGGNWRNDEERLFMLLKNDLSSKGAKRSLKSIRFRVTLEPVEVSGGVMVGKGSVGGWGGGGDCMLLRN